MTQAARIALLFAGSYLVGAIPVGLLVARARGIDIRQHGSGNVGATNVGRVLGRPWGLLVFFLDLAKGASTTVAAGLLMKQLGMLGSADHTRADLVLLGTGICCVIGNTAPIYLWFRGGKGVATSLGVMLGIWPYLTVPGLAAFAVWAIVLKASGYVSLASIVASACLPIAFLVTAWLANWSIADHYPLLLLCIAMTVLVILRHRPNIGRLMAGTESRMGRKVES
jgi:glycerol-3-phosphate acyltransferase PlsY